MEMHLGQQVMDRKGEGVLLGEGVCSCGTLDDPIAPSLDPRDGFCQTRPACCEKSDRRLSLSRENEKEEGLGFDEPAERLQRPSFFLILCLWDSDPRGMEVQISEDPVVALVSRDTTLCCSSLEPGFPGTV